MSEKIIIDATSDSIALSTGAAEQAGVYIVASNPPPTVRQTPIGKPLISTLALMSPVLGCDFRGRPRTASLATPHGTAAALKAEAPQRDPHWLRAAMSESFGLDQCVVDYHDYMAELRESQRRARKAANRRKARRGWR